MREPGPRLGSWADMLLDMLPAGWLNVFSHLGKWSSSELKWSIPFVRFLGAHSKVGGSLSGKSVLLVNFSSPCGSMVPL